MSNIQCQVTINVCKHDGWLLCAMFINKFYFAHIDEQKDAKVQSECTKDCTAYKLMFRVKVIPAIQQPIMDNMLIKKLLTKTYSNLKKSIESIKS